MKVDYRNKINIQQLLSEVYYGLYFKDNPKIFFNVFDKLDNPEKNLIFEALFSLIFTRNLPFIFSYIDVNPSLFRVTNYFPSCGDFSKEDLQYPPPEKARLNRCSFDGQPIFYAANKSDGALMEISKSYIGDSRIPEILYISKWKALNSFRIVDFYYKTTNKDTNIELIKHIQKLDKIIDDESNDPKHDKEKIRFCGDKFAIPTKDAYDFTSLLCNLIYNQSINSQPIQGISYVGVKEDSYSNIAIIPELINNNTVVLTDVVRVAVFGANNAKILAATPKSEIINGEIKLVSPTDINAFRYNQVEKEFDLSF